MSIEKKIAMAIRYARRTVRAADPVNDAANIYADTYEEYCEICRVLSTIIAE